MDFVNLYFVISFALFGCTFSQTGNETAPAVANTTAPMDNSSTTSTNPTTPLLSPAANETAIPSSSASLPVSSNETSPNATASSPPSPAEASPTLSPPETTTESETLSPIDAPVTSASGTGAGATVALVPQGSDAIDPASAVTPAPGAALVPTKPVTPLRPSSPAVNPVQPPIGRNFDFAAVNANRPAAGFLFGVPFNPQWSGMSTRNLQVPEVWQALNTLGRKSLLDAPAWSELLKNAVAGKDYPILAEIPDVRTFSCEKVNQAGFYADADFQCQAVRRCDYNNIMWSYICPNMTLFNQITLTCDWFFNVDCSQSQSFYDYSNSRLYHADWALLDDSQIAQQVGALQPPRGVGTSAPVRPPVVAPPSIPSQSGSAAVQPPRSGSTFPGQQPPQTGLSAVQPPRVGAPITVRPVTTTTQQPRVVLPAARRPVGPFRGNQPQPPAAVPVATPPVSGVSPFRQTFTPVSSPFSSGQRGGQTMTQTMGGQRQSMTMPRMATMNLTPGKLPTSSNALGRSLNSQPSSSTFLRPNNQFANFNRFGQLPVSRT